MNKPRKKPIGASAENTKRPKKPRKAKLEADDVSSKNPVTPKWRLRLYVAGQSAKSMTALENIRKLCETHMPGQYNIEIIDLVKQPQLARGDQIIAIPTLVRELPAPMKKIIGDLSNADRTLVGLDLRPTGQILNDEISAEKR